MSTARPHVRSFADLMQLFAPAGIWFTQFSTLYLAEALICAPSIAEPGALIWIGTAVTVGALAALMAFFLRRRPETGHDNAAFSHDVTMWLALLAGLAVIWTAFPLAVLPVCVPPAG